MFRGAVQFNRPLNNWDVRRCLNMSEMFYNASAFNQPLNSWKPLELVRIDEMFTGAESFAQDITMWHFNNLKPHVVIAFFEMARTLKEKSRSGSGASSSANADAMVLATLLPKTSIVDQVFDAHLRQ